MSTHVIREKIHAVREVVCKNKKYSNDEIVLVLQHYELDVDQAIAAFLEDRSGMILTEWHHQGNNKNKAAKRKKQKARKRLREAEAKAQKEKEKQKAAEEDEEERSSEASSNKENNTPNQNGYHENGVADDDLTSETSSVPSSLLDDVTIPTPPIPTPPKEANGDKPAVEVSPVVSTPTPPPKQPTPTPPNGHTPAQNERVSTPPVPVTPDDPPAPTPPPSVVHLKPVVRSRTPSESSNHSSQSSKSSKKSNNNKSSSSATRRLRKRMKRNLTSTASPNNPSSNANPTNSSSSSALALSNKKGIEKASRDLQRCTVSFGRYRTLLNDEINDSYKRIKEAFEEITNALMNREVDLIRKMDHVKEEAFTLLSKREQRAKELKKQTDRVGTMTSQEMNELKSEIKHFVSERKFDEELGRTTRFTSDRQQLENMIMNFGEVYPVKNSYTLKSDNVRSRHVSTASVQSVESRPKTPTTPLNDHDIPPTTTTAVVKPANLNLNGSGDATAAVDDWAASADNPLPESPASWASLTPTTPTSHDRLQQRPPHHHHQFPPRQHQQQQQQPPSQQLHRSKSYRQRKTSTSSNTSSRKDKEQMPPPSTTPNRYNSSRGGYRGNSRGRYNSNTRGGYRGRGGRGSYRGGGGRSNDDVGKKQPQVINGNGVDK